jgi:hypothetical protein
MEIWKDIKGYEGFYQASNLGRVKSLNYRKSGNEQIMKSSFNSNGYYQIGIRKNGITKVFPVHQLIMMSFYNYTPNGMKYVIDHISGDKLDNRLENLKQVNNRENTVKGNTTKGRSSKYVGVHWHKKNQCWVTQIMLNSRPNYLGSFKTELEAHEAYQNKLKNI